jgi:FKBP-type peptidyl-prolyl cis-trans isomerase
VKIRRGIKLLEEILGTGAVVKSRDTVEYDLTMALNKGGMIEWAIGGVKSNKFSEQSMVARGRMINGVYYTCIGMREGGYRKVKIAPIWGYGTKGFPARGIPANAVLIVEIWIKKIIPTETL